MTRREREKLMDESSVKDKNTIRAHYLEKIYGCQNEEDLDECLDSLNKYELKKLSEAKKKFKNDLLKLKFMALKDDLSNKKGVCNLNYIIDYYNNLMSENIKNYNNLVEYTRICSEDYNQLNEERYLNYANYCDSFYNMINKLVDQIKNRPSNSFLIVLALDTEEAEKSIKCSNQEVFSEVHSIVKTYKER